MTDKAHLHKKPVLFRMTRSNGVYKGTVTHVEPDGFWIESSDVIAELGQDAAWKGVIRDFAGDQLVLFVPSATLQFLIAVQQ